MVGGGIGGLAAALAAAGVGHRVVVLERNERFEELGAGIQLAPNGMHALKRLGLIDRVHDIAVHIDALRFMDGVSGKPVATMPLTAAYQQRFGQPYVVVHRGELHRGLVDACRASPNVELRAGVAVTGYERVGTRVRVLRRDGEPIVGDAIVGADGIRSAVRSQMLAEGDPLVSGITVFRSVIPMDRVPEELRSNSVTWWAGPGCHFVHYPIEGGRSMNLAPSTENGVTSAFSGVRVTAEGVHRELASLGEDVHRLLALGEGWRSWALVDREPVRRWTDGPVVLLGDAAHPMLHYVAQGACQALEDAVTLGDLLGEAAADLGGTFKRFADARRDRTAALQRVSRESISLWHAAGDAAHARNRALADLPPTAMFDHVAWMHDAAGGDRRTAPPG